MVQWAPHLMEAVTTQGANMLHMACQVGHLETATMLLDENANECATTNQGNTPLHLAARSSELAIVDLLIRRRAPLFASNKKGESPMHVACVVGNLSVAKRFLLAGVEPSVMRDNAGRTPAQTAAAYGRDDITDVFYGHEEAKKGDAAAGIRVPAERGITSFLMGKEPPEEGAYY